MSLLLTNYICPPVGKAEEMHTLWIVSASQHQMSGSLLGCDRISGWRFLYNCLYKLLGQISTYISTSTGFGADVVSGESWELVNAVHVGGDSLILQK